VVRYYEVCSDLSERRPAIDVNPRWQKRIMLGMGEHKIFLLGVIVVKKGGQFRTVCGDGFHVPIPLIVGHHCCQQNQLYCATRGGSWGPSSLTQMMPYWLAGNTVYGCA
jgi:hypothetical protein